MADTLIGAVSKSWSVFKLRSSAISRIVSSGVITTNTHGRSEKIMPIAELAAKRLNNVNKIEPTHTSTAINTHAMGVLKYMRSSFFMIAFIFLLPPYL